MSDRNFLWFYYDGDFGWIGDCYIKNITNLILLELHLLINYFGNKLFQKLTVIFGNSTSIASHNKNLNKYRSYQDDVLRLRRLHSVNVDGSVSGSIQQEIVICQ